MLFDAGLILSQAARSVRLVRVIGLRSHFPQDLTMEPFAISELKSWKLKGSRALLLLLEAVYLHTARHEIVHPHPNT